MPKLKSSLPRYQRHRASGQAVVALYGKDFYLGPYGTKASKAEYDRLVGEWIAAGRPSRPPSQTSDITVVELAAAYKTFAKDYYQKNGEPTETVHQVNRASTLVCEKYGRTPAIVRPATRPSTTTSSGASSSVPEVKTYCGPTCCDPPTPTAFRPPNLKYNVWPNDMRHVRPRCPTATRRGPTGSRVPSVRPSSATPPRRARTRPRRPVRMRQASWPPSRPSPRSPARSRRPAWPAWASSAWPSPSRPRCLTWAPRACWSWPSSSSAVSPVRRIACLLLDLLGLSRVMRIVEVSHEMSCRRIFHAPFVKQL